MKVKSISVEGGKITVEVTNDEPQQEAVTIQFGMVSIKPDLYGDVITPEALEAAVEQWKKDQRRDLKFWWDKDRFKFDDIRWHRFYNMDYSRYSSSPFVYMIEP